LAARSVPRTGAVTRPHSWSSRSGATIAGGLALGYERVAAAKYSFLLAVPAVVGSGLFKLADISSDPVPPAWGPIVLATVISFAIGYVVIAWLLRYVSTHKLHAVRDLSNRAGRSGGHLVAHWSTEPIAPGGELWPALTTYGPTPERSNASAATVSALIFSSTELPCGATAHVVTPDAASS
jgi:hypothetical protein